jgi:HAMP domain-containing protein
MMKAKRRSVAVVVVAAVLVAVATVVLATFGAVNHLSRRAEQQRRLRLEQGAQADQLAAGLVVAVWNIDRAQIDKIIEALAATPAVEAVYVTAAGRVHARVRDAEWRLVPSSESPPARGALVEDREITFSGEPIGSLRITATPRFIEADLRRSLVTLAGAVVATDILLVLGVYFVLWRLVLRPLLAVERYAVAVSAERSGAAAPIAPAFTAELASLQTSIETMVRLLDQRYAELREEMARRLELQESLRRSEVA